jgi:hypothetical protein
VGFARRGRGELLAGCEVGFIEENLHILFRAMRYELARSKIWQILTRGVRASKDCGVD